MQLSNAVRAAVLRYLNEHGPIPSISAMAEEIRRTNPQLRQVPDFDFRATVLSLMALGRVQSTPQIRIAAVGKI